MEKNTHTPRPLHLAQAEPLLRERLKATVVLTVTGGSMLPLLAGGRDRVTLGPVPERLRRGEVLLYRRADGSYVLHRVTAVTSQGLTMMGDNQLKPETGVSPEWVIGRVTRIFRDDKEVSRSGSGYRWYLGLWRFTISRGFLLKLCHFVERRNAS